MQKVLKKNIIESINFACLFNILSPCCRLELVDQRKKTLIYVDLKYSIEVVGSDHLTGKTDDYYEFLIIKELSEPIEKFI